MDKDFIKTVLTVSIVAAAICGCGAAPPDAPDGGILAGRPVPFTLRVCNQSKAISPVDIRVAIDGTVVIHEEFVVGRQLNWKEFEMTLAAGKHRIEVVSRKGGARLAETFLLARRGEADLQFWYYPETHRFATPRQFRFDLQENAPAPAEVFNVRQASERSGAGS